MSMHGAGPWMAYQSLMRDKSVKQQRLARGTLKRIRQYAVPFKSLIVAFLGILVIQSLLLIAQPLIFKRIVDDAIPNKHASTVTWLALGLVGLAVVDAALGLVSRRMSAQIGEGLIYDLRTDVFDHVQNQSIAFFTRAQTGALISRINSDVIGAQRAFTSTLGGLVGNIITLIAVLLTMVTLSWQITIAGLLLFPLFLFPARLLGQRLQGLTREQTDVNAAMSTQMSERFNVSGALLMKLFGKPETESKNFATRAAQVRDIGVTMGVTSNLFFTIMMSITALATALVYGIGGNFVIKDSLSLGTLLALVALLGRIYGPMAALANVRVDIMTALVSFERVFEVLDLEPMVKDAPDATDLQRGPAKVAFDHVSFRYPAAHEVSLASLEVIARPDARVPEGLILNDVSFAAEPGQLVALVGPSGAGKTTITSLVARLFDPTEGRVLVNGKDIRTVTQNSLHDLVGVVSQDSHMFHDTIRANLLYARPEASDDELRQACQAAQIDHLITELPEGLDTVVGDRGHRLSGGEKQRLAIARLLLKAPDIVILDEATAHLDSESETLVQEALSHALVGRTSLVIAHRLSTIRQADQILVLEDGQIVQRGTHDELLASGGLYADLYNLQFAYQEVTD